MRLSLRIVLASMLAAVLVATAGSAEASGGRPIRPGVQVIIKGAQCTGNFVFQRRTRSGKHLYLGTAAHCDGKGSDTAVNGCHTGSFPLGTKVRIVVGYNNLSNGRQIGTGHVAYSSWIAMHRAHTSAYAPCNFNDLALISLPRSAWSRVRGRVPDLGGPTGLAALPGKGGAVYARGASGNRFAPVSMKGKVLKRVPWSMNVRTTPPGISGDSGSGYMNSRGQAVGVLSTIDGLLGLSGNGVGSLQREVWFARGHGMSHLALWHGGSFRG